MLDLLLSTHVNLLTSTLCLVYYDELVAIHACCLCWNSARASTKMHPHHWLFLCTLFSVFMLQELINSFFFLRTGLPALPPPSSEEVVKEMNMWYWLISHHKLFHSQIYDVRWANSKCTWCVITSHNYWFSHINKLLINNQILHLLCIIHHNYHHDMFYFEVVLFYVQLLLSTCLYCTFVLIIVSYCCYCWVHVCTVRLY